MGDEDHTGFCIPSIKPLKHITAGTEIPIKDNFDFAEALESVYPLLNIIFSYLDCEDLKIASQVKESWRAIAQKELSKRMSLNWVSCYKGKGSGKGKQRNYIEHSNNSHFCNASIGIIFYDYRRLKLNKYICCHMAQVTRMTFAEYFAKEIVPKGINYCLISCAKVVSNFIGDNIRQLVNQSNDTTYPVFDGLFNGVFLPHIPKIRTTMFHCNPVKHQNVKETVDMYIKSNEYLKCLLLFSVGSIHKSIDNLFKCLFPSGRYENIAVCGGIIRGTKTFQQISAQRQFSANDTFCICFLEKIGSKSDFNAVSSVIKGDDLTDEEFEKELIKLRKRVVMRTHSLAIRICCAAKWANKESETPLFSKIFPEVSLLGLEADGELGWNSYSDLEEKTYGDVDSEAKAKRSKRCYPQLEHAWSTILLIITWGELTEQK